MLLLFKTNKTIYSSNMNEDPLSLFALPILSS